MVILSLGRPSSGLTVAIRAPRASSLMDILVADSFHSVSWCVSGFAGFHSFLGSHRSRLLSRSHAVIQRFWRFTNDAFQRSYHLTALKGTPRRP